MDKLRAFIERTKRDVFDAAEAGFINAQMELCSEFDRPVCLSPHNRTDLGLADADDTVLYLMGMIVVHVLLLLVKLMDRDDAVDVFLRRDAACLHVSVDISEIPADIAQLGLHRRPDLLSRWFLCFGKCKVFLMRHLAENA